MYIRILLTFFFIHSIFSGTIQINERILSDADSICPSGRTPKSKGIAPTTNGCGSKRWHVSLGNAIGPFISDFTNCCNAHDKCYGTCQKNNYFNGCNN